MPYVDHSTERIMYICYWHELINWSKLDLCICVEQKGPTCINEFDWQQRNTKCCSKALKILSQPDSLNQCNLQHVVVMPMHKIEHRQSRTVPKSFFTPNLQLCVFSSHFQDGGKWNPGKELCFCLKVRFMTILVYNNIN